MVSEELDDKINSFHYRCFTNDDVDTAYSKIKSVSIKPVKKIDPYYLCIVATETSKDGKPHIHAKIDTNMSQPTLRARLKKVYPSRGNKSYSLEFERTDRNISYVVKCGVYRYCPEMAESINNAPKWVFPSESVDRFEKSYALLEGLYLTTDMSDYEFVYKLLGLYADHKKAIYIPHLRAKWLGVANQRNKAPEQHSRFRVSGNARPFRHRVVEEILRGFYIYDN